MSRHRNQTHLSLPCSQQCTVLMLAIALAIWSGESQFLRGAEDQPSADQKRNACKVLADKRLEDPIRTIAKEYSRRMGTQVEVRLLPAAEVNQLVEAKRAESDVVLSMAKKEEKTPVSSLPDARNVAWKYPGGQPVWAAVTGDHSEASDVVRFIGGPTGHRLWSESPAGFTMTSGKTHAEAFKWVADNRVAHTYPMTAMRVLRECGGITEGTCIDIGCGPGNLDVELAKRTKLKIIGLDIDADMKPLFDQKIREAGFQDRVRFVVGDAQDLPFPDDFADAIVSRGTLTFIPDIGKCLREVDRVLKPTGMAFLGGRYVYTPHKHKISNEKLKQIVKESGVEGAQVITERGQWVKIIGPEVPEAARNVRQGPHLLAGRFIADYYITEGQLLHICRGDGGLEQALQKGFIDLTDVQITALYPKEDVAAKARERIRAAKHDDRITCKVGNVYDLPFDDGSFHAIAGVGPILLWGEREKAMKEIYRVLRTGGVARIGGRFLHMPDWRKTSSETLRASASKTGISSIRVIDDMGQWVEIRKGIQDRGFRD